MRIVIEMLNPIGVKGTGPADQPMHHVAFFQQEFGQVAAVLTSDPGNYSELHIIGHGLISQSSLLPVAHGARKEADC